MVRKGFYMLIFGIFFVSTGSAKYLNTSGWMRERKKIVLWKVSSYKRPFCLNSAECLSLPLALKTTLLFLFVKNICMYLFIYFWYDIKAVSLADVINVNKRQWLHRGHSPGKTRCECDWQIGLLIFSFYSTCR